MLTTLPPTYQDAATKIIQSASDNPTNLDHKFAFFPYFSIEFQVFSFLCCC